MHTTPIQTSQGGWDAVYWLRRAAIYGGWVILIYLGYRFLVRDALKYLEYTPEVYRRFWSVRWALVAHVAAASVGLILAPLQFINAVRRKWPRVHRMIGWVYVVCAAVSIPAVYRLTMATNCSTCVAPFFAWTTVFLIVTTLAVVMAVRRRLDVHRQFMIRSYVLMNGFVLVRLDTHIPFPLGDVASLERAGVLLWAVWVVPLLLTEMWFSWVPLIFRRALRARAQ